MRCILEVNLRTLSRLYCKMSGVSREAPIGVQMIQRLSSKCCPRLQINRLRWYQVSVLLLTFFTYMTYHLTRKPISVVKSVLHQNCSRFVPPPDVNPADDEWCNWAPFNTSDANALLGALDSAFLFSYAAAMFVSGMIAERVDLRYFLSLGMLVSAIFCYLFGIAKTYNIHNISYYLLVQAGAGIAQTTGWPGTVAIVGKWFGDGKKGLIFGIWNSHTSLGNILGTAMASEYVDSDWALSFVYPGVVMGAMGALVWLLLPPEPRCVGLATADTRHEPVRQVTKSDEEDVGEEENEDDETSSVIVGDQSANIRPHRYSANAGQGSQEEASERTRLLPPHPAHPAGGGAPRAVSLSRALAIPGVVEFSLSLFFAKLVSYTFLYWLPAYIHYSLPYLSAREAGELSIAFDAGGVAGAIAAGLLADCTASPALVCVSFYTLCAPMLLVYQWCGAGSYATNAVLLALAGALVNGPYALITTAVSAELGTHRSLARSAQALATVTAIVDGTGSVGAAVGPLVAGLVSGHSWAHVFYVLIACDLLALLLLIRIAKHEIAKIRLNRRLSSPPRVRVE